MHWGKLVEFYVEVKAEDTYEVSDTEKRIKEVNRNDISRENVS